MKKTMLMLIALALCTQAIAQETEIKPTSLIQNTTISGNWYLAYTYNEPKDLGVFNLKRGYFTLQTKLNDIFSVRYTQDITLDDEGTDAGNVEIRMKYLFMKMQLTPIEVLKNTYFVFGLTQRPWIDFEQSINRYRVQGKMFGERYDIIGSADFGILYEGILGGKLDENYQNNVNNKYPGKYGSFGIGIFNGPGYHAIELNSNKTLEGRLTLRPLSTAMPGLQLTYAFAYGKNNTPDSKTDFTINTFFLSSESKLHTFTAQYYKGVGDSENAYSDINGLAYENDGFSLFGEFNIPKTKLSLFARYDQFVSHQATDLKEEALVGGVAYKFLKNKLVLDFDQTKTETTDKNIYELALEINF